MCSSSVHQLFQLDTIIISIWHLHILSLSLPSQDSLHKQVHIDTFTTIVVYSRWPSLSSQVSRQKAYPKQSRNLSIPISQLHSISQFAGSVCADAHLMRTWQIRYCFVFCSGLGVQLAPREKVL